MRSIAEIIADLDKQQCSLTANALGVGIMIRLLAELQLAILVVQSIPLEPELDIERYRNDATFNRLTTTLSLLMESNGISAADIISAARIAAFQLTERQQ